MTAVNHGFKINSVENNIYTQHAKRKTETLCCYQPVSRPESIIRQLNLFLGCLMLLILFIFLFIGACVFCEKRRGTSAGVRRFGVKTRGTSAGVRRVGGVPRQGDEHGGPGDGNKTGTQREKNVSAER